MKALLIALIFVIAQHSYAGNEGRVAGNDGHGGGGITKNGKYMSFYTAGLYVKPQNNTTSITHELPAIDDLIQYISGLNELDIERKSDILNAILPTGKRQYLIASPKELTPQVHSRLMEEFKRVTGVSTENLHLFAITDIPQGITYILPGFENLSRADQVALLFHEAYWILNPRSTYNQVVAAEMAFQATYTNPNDKAAMYDFLSKVRASSDKIGLALAKWDIEQGNLNGLVNQKGQIPLRKILGEEFIRCAPNSPSGIFSCFVYIKKNVYDLRRLYPRSMLIKKISEIVTDDSNIYRGFIGIKRPDGAFYYEGVIEKYTWYHNDLRLKLLSCPVELLETSVPSCNVGKSLKNTQLALSFERR